MTQEVPDNREWLSYREAQLLTGLGRTTLWRAASEGRIVVSKQGRAVRLLRRSLKDLMCQGVPANKVETTQCMTYEEERDV